MRTRDFISLALVFVVTAAGAAEKRGIGSPVSPQEIAGWDIDVRGDGTGLPSGSGTARQGQTIFASRCAKCHGDEGQGDSEGPALKGGIGSLATKNPVKTIGSFWPYAPPIFDYVRRSMPLDAPQSLAPDEVYALAAFLLHVNGQLPDQEEHISRTNLPLIAMPNRDGFVSDDREQSEKSFWNRNPCVRNCAPVETIDGR